MSENLNATPAVDPAGEFLAAEKIKHEIERRFSKVSEGPPMYGFRQLAPDGSYLTTIYTTHALGGGIDEANTLHLVDILLAHYKVQGSAQMEPFHYKGDHLVWRKHPVVVKEGKTLRVSCRLGITPLRTVPEELER